MFSICIPRYDYDCSPLVAALRKQLPGAAEILVIDDGSTLELPDPGADKLVRLEQNVGRAAIRNRFLSLAKNDWLLYLDNDVQLGTAHFLATYLDAVQQDPQPRMLYGGRIYPEQEPTAAFRLRWRYGRQAESKPARIRSTDPYRSFHSNNFLVHRSVLEQVPFDEAIKEYGYEDSVLALQLKGQGIRIEHLDNPVLNDQLESNQRFLELTEIAIRNLKALQQRTAGQPHALSEVVSLLRYKALAPLLKPLQPYLYKKLAEGKAPLLYFQLWKVSQL